MSSLSFEFAWVPSGAPSGSRVHSGSRGFTRASLGDVGFILVCLGSLGRNKGSSGSFGLVWRPLCAPKVAGFIGVHVVTPVRSPGSFSGSRGSLGRASGS